MTVRSLSPHLTISFHHLPTGSYLHLDELYEIDRVDRRDVYMHSVASGSPIIQSIAHLRDARFHLA